MAIKTKYQINAVIGAGSSIYLWKITDLITGNIYFYPVNNCTFTMLVNSISDYSFTWKKDDVNQLSVNIIDVKLNYYHNDLELYFIY